MSELYHYGRSKKDGAPVGSGRYPLGSGKSFEKGTAFYRYSDTNERNIRSGSYFFKNISRDDDSSYYNMFIEGALSGDPNKGVYKTTVSNTKPIIIRDGRDTVYDCLLKIGDEKLFKEYNKLDKKGYFEPQNSGNDRFRMEYKDKKLSLYSGDLNHAIKNYVSGNRTELANEYKKAGYSAVIDPEDYLSNFDMPLIITDPSAFKITSSKKQ